MQVEFSQVEAFVREQGSGPGVVCFHANCGTSGQWRGLMDQLAPTHHVFAIDSYGAGKTSPWNMQRPLTLADEVALADAVFDRAGHPLILIGHSYGAAVALKAALAQPERVRAMVIYEPPLIDTVSLVEPSPNGTEDLALAVMAAVRAARAGDTDSAARLFIDYWSGEGSWAATPEKFKPAISKSMEEVETWVQALSEAISPAEFQRLDFPILYLLGQDSPRSTHAVSRVLAAAMPNITVVEMAGIGHMGPITHADQVNAEIVRFLAQA